MPSRLSRGKRMLTDGLTLRGPFLRMLRGNVMSDDAAADCTHDRMMARIVAGDTAHDGAFQAAGGICCSGCRQA